MSIKSTKEVTREFAITRIKQIDSLCCGSKYRGLESVTRETEENLQKFVDGYVPVKAPMHLNDWTNTMLGDKLDEPFFRESPFDNYLVKDDEAS